MYYLSLGTTDETMNQFILYFFIGVYGPFIGSIITTKYYGSFKDVLDLFKKLFIWRMPLINYLTVIVLPLIFFGSGIGLYALFVGPIGSFENKVWAIPALLLNSVRIGPLGEELGWRGFLLPELQKYNSPLKTALIIGFIHFIWHLPLFWAPFGTLVSGEPLSVFFILTYLALVTCWSVVQSWLVNNSNGSVLISILFHLFINAGVALLFFPMLASDSHASKVVYYASAVVTIPFVIYLALRTKLEPGKGNLRVSG